MTPGRQWPSRPDDRRGRTLLSPQHLSRSQHQGGSHHGEVRCPVANRSSTSLGVRALTLVAILAAILSACGDERSVSTAARRGSQARTPTPQATTPSRPATPPSPPATSPTRTPDTEARTPGTEPPRTPPRSRATPPDATGELLRISAAESTGDGRSLQLTYTLPTPCSPGLREAHVTERPDEVVVTLYRRSPRPGDEGVFCSQVLTEKSVTVRLERPLGDRTLVDGSSGSQVPVARR